MNPYYPHLFEPITIKKTTFRNRLFTAPHMMSHMDFNGRPDESMIDFYAEKARGGFAVVTLGDTPVDRAVSYTHLRAHETEQDLVCRLLVESWRRSPGPSTPAGPWPLRS